MFNINETKTMLLYILCYYKTSKNEANVNRSLTQGPKSNCSVGVTSKFW